MSGLSRGNPAEGPSRPRGPSGGRRSKPIRALAVVAAVVVGAAACATSSPSTATTATSTGPSTGGPSPVSSASTSSRGVTEHSINVVFPLVALNSLAGQEGFAEDAEFGEQAKAINLFVNQINDGGGINGRKINAILTSFDPTNETQMRALCKTWTEGSPAAFAVLDGLGDWTGDDQLCITQEGHTPFLGAWSTVTNWTNEGSPYLWWTGPDQATVLQAVVNWGLSAHLLGGTTKVGIIAGDRASDQNALDDYLLPDLRNAGVTPVVKTINANPDDTATTDAEAPLVIQQLRSAGITSIIPLMPFNVFFPVLQAETSQQWYPKLLLSDYEGSIESSLGLLPVPYAKALDGQEGVTTETLGGIDSPRPQSQGGYDPAVRKCWNVWHKAYPQVPPGNMNDLIEEQGPIVGWCQVIALFATAAKNAGADLNRRTFVTAMSKITNFPGTWSTVLSYGPNKRYGPTEYQVVKLRVNSPPSPLCKTTPGKPPAATCWVSVRPFVPLPTG
ncbi:MAG: ABC transporter substrate-binding protein [Acidimicrobiales bacterium]